MEKLQVAIDGPAGAGKSTVARIVAERLGYIYIDTGAMYRAVALAVLRAGVDVADEARVADLAGSLDLLLEPSGGERPGRVLLGGEDVTNALRSPEVSEVVPMIAQNQAVRRILVAQQQRIASEGGVVMDGRDIGTVVLPAAQIKVFLTASIAERTRRRIQEMESRGFAADPVRVRAAIIERDQLDRARASSPLRQAADAQLIDTSEIGVSQVVEQIVALCRTTAAR